MADNDPTEGERDIFTSPPSAEELARSLQKSTKREKTYFDRRREVGLGVGLDGRGRMVSQMSIDADANGISSKAIMRVFGNIADAWRLTVEERMGLLGVNHPGEIDGILTGDQPMSAEVAERISYCFGIFNAINILLPDPSQADTWIKRPNSAPLFDGVDALSYMLSHGANGLRAVRRYLDAERH